MAAMKRENTRRIMASTAVLGLALAAVSFYSVRDLMAAFVLFSIVSLALGAALFLVLSAEQAVVWAVRWTESHVGHFTTARHLGLAAHAGIPQHRIRSRG
jgi:hypothetical protein